MEVGFYDLFTSYVMELEWHGMLYVSMVWYGMLVHGMMLVSQGIVGYVHNFSIVGYGLVCQYGMVRQNGMMLVCYGMLCYSLLYQFVGFHELFKGYEM